VNEDPHPFDDHYHGTLVAGVVAAEDNGSGVVGVAPRAQLYALNLGGDLNLYRGRIGQACG
jgi:subtilisin family serine protease